MCTNLNQYTITAAWQKASEAARNLDSYKLFKETIREELINDRINCYDENYCDLSCIDDVIANINRSLSP